MIFQLKNLVLVNKNKNTLQLNTNCFHAGIMRIIVYKLNMLEGGQDEGTCTGEDGAVNRGLLLNWRIGLKPLHSRNFFGEGNIYFSTFSSHPQEKRLDEVFNFQDSHICQSASKWLGTFFLVRGGITDHLEMEVKISIDLSQPSECFMSHMETKIKLDTEKVS